MSQLNFHIGSAKLEALHAEAADRRNARLAVRTPWTDFVRWIGNRFGSL